MKAGGSQNIDIRGRDCSMLWTRDCQKNFQGEEKLPKLIRGEIAFLGFSWE